MVRYIHLNPLRAGVVNTIDELDSYPWCGHGVLLGKHEFSGQRSDDVLLLFGLKEKTVRQTYRDFVIDGIKQGCRDDLVGGGLHRSQGVRGRGEYEAYDERILGSGEFVERLWRETESPEITIPPTTLDGIIRKTAETMGVTVDLLRQRNRVKDLVDARGVICYLAVRESNYSGVAVARALHMSRSGVSVAVKRGGEIVKENPELKGKLID